MALIVLVATDRRRRDGEVVQELLGLTCVFAGDAIGAFENVEGTEGDVVEVADGRGDQIEAGVERFVRHGDSSRFLVHSKASRRVVRELRAGERTPENSELRTVNCLYCYSAS